MSWPRTNPVPLSSGLWLIYTGMLWTINDYKIWWILMFYWCFGCFFFKCFMMFVDILWCLMMCFDVQNTLNLEMRLTFSRPVADHFACPFGHRSVGLWESWYPGLHDSSRPSKCCSHCPAVLAKQDGKIHFGANGKRSHLTQHTPTIPPRNKNPLTPYLPTYMGLSENSVPKFIGSSSFSGHSLFKSTSWCNHTAQAWFLCT